MLGRTLDEKAKIISPEDYWKHEVNCEKYEENDLWWYLDLFEQEDSEYYWDSISWPKRYVSDLDGNRPIWKSSDWYYRPKHRRTWRPGSPAKHWKGESRRRQYYKDKAKSHQRMAIRDAFNGSPNQLRRGWIASAWDIN